MSRMAVLLGTSATALLLQIGSVSTALAQATGGFSENTDAMSGGLLGIAFIYLVIIRPFLKKRKKE